MYLRLETKTTMALKWYKLLMVKRSRFAIFSKAESETFFNTTSVCSLIYSPG